MSRTPRSHPRRRPGAGDDYIHARHAPSAHAVCVEHDVSTASCVPSIPGGRWVGRWGEPAAGLGKSKSKSYAPLFPVEHVRVDNWR